MRRKWKFSYHFSEVHPFIPVKLAYVEDVSLLTKCCIVRVLSPKMKQILCCHTCYERSFFSTVVPKYKWGVFIQHVFPYSFLENINIKLRSVSPLCRTLEDPESCANLVANSFTSFDLFHLWRSSIMASGTPTSLENSSSALENSLALFIAVT